MSPEKHVIEIQTGTKKIKVGDGSFTVIAGPCSIESYQQFFSTAKVVAEQGASLLRGGVWKLRTSSKTFQGLGGEAFDIVRKVTHEMNMGITIEVTDPRQIEELHPMVSMFQVGSRNMHNYALLKELAKQDKPVLLKRGFAALVSEWLSAAEYINQTGAPKVILCERGIRTFETSTRNTLDLNSAIYAKKNTPYPVIVDPSHGVGISQLVPDLALAATALGIDGLIMEVHPNPKEALSDGMQALTFENYDHLMTKVDKVLTALDRSIQRL
ncbi:MAG: 3-deoxy-7-phosphoheptulonate synthase [Bdellovibrionaceae bacterium]|nr:3-deoxy-7-phosphoheptulonate synthase [Pseudobdellovibrionaceae bacterium]